MVCIIFISILTLLIQRNLNFLHWRVIVTVTCGWGTVVLMHNCLGLISFSWEYLDGTELLLHSLSEEILCLPCVLSCSHCKDMNKYLLNLDRKAINMYNQSSALWTDKFSAINYRLQDYRLFSWAVMRYGLFKQKLGNLTYE